jgi:hypothetical protein
MVSSENPISAATAPKVWRSTCSVTPSNAASRTSGPILLVGPQNARHRAMQEKPKGNHRARVALQLGLRLRFRWVEAVHHFSYPRSGCNLLGCPPTHGGDEGPPCDVNQSAEAGGGFSPASFASRIVRPSLAISSGARNRRCLRTGNYGEARANPLLQPLPRLGSRFESLRPLQSSLVRSVSSPRTWVTERT